MRSVGRLWELTRFFYHQRVQGFSVPDDPWFDSASSDPFRKLLTGAGSYVEYGSGGSTLLADRAHIPTVAVEGDRFFARAVARKITDSNLTRLLVADIGTTVEWGIPLFKAPTERRKARWLSYVDAPYRALRTLDRALPDLVLVDGRMRRACALEAVRQAQVGNQAVTLCFDDYTSREYYNGVEAWLGKPRMAGRMAIFHSDDSVKPIARNEVLEAAQDWR